MAANNKAGEVYIEGYIALPDPEQMQDRTMSDEQSLQERAARHPHRANQQTRA